MSRLVTNPAAFGRVAVLMGGTSSEREVSLKLNSLSFFGREIQ